MSLLNDMLRDLVQKQQNSANASTYEQVVRREAVQVEDSGFTRFTKLSLFFIVVFTLVLLVKNLVVHHQFYWSTLPSNKQESNEKNIQSIPAPQSVPSNKRLNIKPNEPQMAKQVPQGTVNPTDSLMLVQSSTQHSAEEIAQEKIEGLLAHAKFAISQDKLTSPIEDNAFSDYQRILQIDSDNREAKQGIEYIASRYIARAQEQLKLGNTQQAQSYFQRAEFIAPDFFQSEMETAAGYNNESLLASATLAKSVSSDETSKSKITQFSTDTLGSNVEKKSGDNAGVATAKTTVTPEIVEAQHLEIAPTNKWQDEDTARIARDLVNQQQIAEAKALLEKTLAVHFQAPRSLALLHELYLKESNTTAADNLTNRADFLPEDQRYLMRAQSLLAQAKENDAIKMLQEHLASAVNNEAYRALLASLYHKTGQYQSSVTQYQQLIKNFGDKPTYWLGLALGYDGLVQPKNAEQCYQHLKKFTQLQPQVLAYVDKRLAALQVN